MKDWITIMTFTYPQDSYIIKGALESGGIETFLKDELTIQVDNFLSNAIGGVQLQVKKDQADRAIEILKSNGYFNTNEDTKSQSKKIQVLSKSDHNTSLCPYCSSENIEKVKRTRFVTVMLILLLYQPFPFFKIHYQCFDCSMEWKYKK